MAEQSLPRRLGLGARRGVGQAWDFAMRGPRHLMDTYRDALPSIAELGSSFLYGDDNEAPAEAAPAPQPPPQVAKRSGLPPLKPWDQKATDTMLGLTRNIDEVAQEATRPHLRYDISGVGDDKMTDFLKSGADERLPGARSGGGTVSMMSGSPEAARHATSASRLEDLGQQITESQLRATLEDPYGIRRSQAEARVKQNPVDVQKSDLINELANFESEIGGMVQRGEMSQQDAQQRLAEARARAQRYADLMKSGFPPLGSDMSEIPAQ